MPIPDFSKVWASASPLPEYTFTDSEYITGWDFVGSAPPTKNEFDAWFKMVDEKLNYLYGQLQTTASKLYPIGSVYISFNSADPSTLFGGTWTRLKDTFLLASGDAYAPNTSGGSPTKTIAVSNMPSHNHSVSSSGSHTHSSANVTVSTVSGHTHAPGTMNIKGTFSGVGQHYNTGGGMRENVVTGAFYRVNTTNNPSQGVRLGESSTAERDDYFGFEASRSWTGATASAGSHTHTVSIASSGSHTHTTTNVGGGTPLNIMPPYMTVYMWRRTA